MQVVGVDGCRGDWLCAALDDTAGSVTFARLGDLHAILAAYPDAACVGIDIPIGLGEAEPRACDIAARRLLGWPRQASVFPAPPRSLLDLPDHATASRQSRERFGRGIAVQAFGIYRKVAEVDRIMTPVLQQRVREVHPEVSFWALACGRAMRHAKKTEDGFAERRELLRAAVPQVDIPTTRAAARRMAPCGGADDLLDALATAWTALRVARGTAQHLPDDPPCDTRGLRMEIVY